MPGVARRALVIAHRRNSAASGDCLLRQTLAQDSGEGQTLELFGVPGCEAVAGGEAPRWTKALLLGRCVIGKRTAQRMSLFCIFATAGRQLETHPISHPNASRRRQDCSFLFARKHAFQLEMTMALTIGAAENNRMMSDCVVGSAILIRRARLKQTFVCL